MVGLIIRNKININDVFRAVVIAPKGLLCSKAQPVPTFGGSNLFCNKVANEIASIDEKSISQRRNVNGSSNLQKNQYE